jgi:hypothetical protein
MGHNGTALRDVFDGAIGNSFFRHFFSVARDDKSKNEKDD